MLTWMSILLWFICAEIKPAQCCIKLVFHLTYTMMHGSTKLKYICALVICNKNARF